MKLGYSIMFMWAFIWNFDQATHVSLIENESYQLSPERTKIMVNTRDNINTLVS